MEISQSLLGLMYVWAVLAGVAWGVSYDVLRLSRVVFGLSGRMTRAARWKRTCRSVVLFSQDVLFGLIGGMMGGDISKETLMELNAELNKVPVK